MVEAYRVGYNPLPTANRVADLSRRLKRSMFQLVLSALLFTGLVVWQHSSLSTPVNVLLLLVGWLPSLVMLAWTIVRLVSARRSLGVIGTGDAMVISRAGIEGHTPGREPERMPWQDIDAVVGVHKVLGAGPELAVVRHDGRRWSVPLGFLDVQAGTIDNALRVFSGGRRGLDLSDLDI